MPYEKIRKIPKHLTPFSPLTIQGALELPNPLDPGKMVADTSNIKLNPDGSIRGGFIENEKTQLSHEIGQIYNQLKEEQSSTNWNPLKAELTEKQKYDTATTALDIVGNIANTAMNAVDEATMGDKNFSAQSQAIDAGVHGLSSMAMKSGNPYLMAAGVALEGLNFVTKAGGRTVPGFDVDIQSSGYGNLGHMESSSGRIWDKWTGKTGRLLAKRNEQARMALSAADISQDQAYEQEARTNSVTNVLQANQIALAGGIDTSLLGN